MFNFETSLGSIIYNELKQMINLEGQTFSIYFYRYIYLGYLMTNASGNFVCNIFILCLISCSFLCLSVCLVISENTNELINNIKSNEIYINTFDLLIYSLDEVL